MPDATDIILANGCHSPRPSKVTIPPRANPHAKLVFALMQRYNVTYDELEYRSGLLRSTIKAWRTDNVPSLTSIEAALGSFGWTLVPCPPLSDLKPETLEKVEDVGMDFVSDNEALAAIMATVCKVPVAQWEPISPFKRPADGRFIALQRPVGPWRGVMVDPAADKLGSATSLGPSHLEHLSAADVIAIADVLRARQVGEAKD